MMKNPHEKRIFANDNCQTENDFYLDGDELIMPVYPRHHRSNDHHHHHYDYDQMLMVKMGMWVC